MTIYKKTLNRTFHRKIHLWTCQCETFSKIFSTYRSSHRRCSVKKMFLEISQNSQENTLTLLPHWCKISISIIELEPRLPLKKAVFWSNSYKIEIMITSLTEMLKLPNICHMTTFTL